MSSAKVQVVVHDNNGGWEDRSIPGLETKTFPFFAYVLGNPGIHASGMTEKEVLDRVRESLLVSLDARSTRKLIELDLGDHVVVSDIMSG